MPLPHNEIYNDIPAAEAIARLRRSPKEDVVFAFSQGFRDAEEREAWDSVYPAYDDYFERKVAECRGVLGPTSYEGSWTDEAYPAFAVGERIAVWGAGEDTVYLRIDQQDGEIGIEVSLVTPRSPSSHDGPESRYKALRKALKENPPQ